MSRADRIVLIMTDTQRADMLGCYADTGLKTPSLDRLAAGGVRFDCAYTCQPVCGPARSALFTGLYPHGNSSWANTMALATNVKTVGQRLRDHGVHTGYVGKWHVDGGDYFGLGRCPDGWDPGYWYDMRNYLDELSPEERVRSRKASTNRDPDLTEDFTFGHRCSNRAVDFLERHADDRFFLVVSYDEPHGPHLCPRPWSEMYRDYEFPKSPNVYDTLEGKPEHHKVWAGGRLEQDRDAVRIHRPDFFGCNSFVDHQIGRVLEAVDEHAPDAMVIYTADHGSMMQSHCLDGKGPAMYDEITRIPFIVRWPGQAPEGSACPHPVSHIGVVPTVMDAMGLPQPQWCHGRSMLETFREPDRPAGDAVFIEFGRYEIDHDGFGGFQPVRCVFDGRYKLAINLLTSDELYDLESDPGEMVNLIESADHAEVRSRLHDRLLRWMNETRDPFRGYYWERRPWRTDARDATWDYAGMTRQREHEEYEPRQLDYSTGLEMEQATREK
ncbi:MAG: sulfatase-like hydrolase/transferase [Planctomycetota bacterium]